MYEKRIVELDKELSKAKDLLQEARELMYNMHCYDYSIYHEIGKYLYDEDE